MNEAKALGKVRIEGKDYIMADGDVVDDALQPTDDVGEHRRPRKLPHRGTEGTFSDGAIECAVGHSGIGAGADEYRQRNMVP